MSPSVECLAGIIQTLNARRMLARKRSRGHRIWTSTNNTINVMIAGYVALIMKIVNPYKLCIGKSEEKRPIGRPRLGWKVNIEI